MSEERPLTEFSASEEVDGEATESMEPPSGVEPATVTYQWQPDGTECAQCGATTEQRWLDDGQFVCPDCKSWA
ncbi:DNA repair protein RadA [Halohasta salina]|uniref:DNA repair protein RadA n=1 Tax=Halohasta salina TaxID=2961621 RepID=UPI0020A4C738|nr:DNA repair protein RadA [Halohasta salina]